MRSKEMIQRDLDAVARTFPNSRGSMLMGKISLESNPQVPQAFKRYDFLANGGDLSVEEARLMRTE